jgi:hypothetical protein
MNEKSIKCIKLKIMEGDYLTATERRAVQAMLQNNWTTAHNQPCTKSYRITRLTGLDFDLEIGTKAVWAIGDIAKWRYYMYKIGYKK